MPLTEKGEEIKNNMEKQYGKEKGEKVFYASANKGTITGVHDVEESHPKSDAYFPTTNLTLADINKRSREYWKDWAPENGGGKDK